MASTTSDPARALRIANGVAEALAQSECEKTGQLAAVSAERDVYRELAKIAIQHLHIKTMDCRRLEASRDRLIAQHRALRDQVAQTRAAA